MRPPRCGRCSDLLPGCRRSCPTRSSSEVRRPCCTPGTATSTTTTSCPIWLLGTRPCSKPSRPPQGGRPRSGDEAALHHHGEPGRCRGRPPADAPHPPPRDRRGRGGTRRHRGRPHRCRGVARARRTSSSSATWCATTSTWPRSSEHLGEDTSAEILSGIDAYDDDRSGEPSSVSTSLVMVGGSGASGPGCDLRAAPLQGARGLAPLGRRRRRVPGARTAAGGAV